MNKAALPPLLPSDSAALSVTLVDANTLATIPIVGSYASLTTSNFLFIEVNITLADSGVPLTSLLLSFIQNGTSDAGLSLYVATSYRIISSDEVALNRYVFSGHSRIDAEAAQFLGASQAGSHYFALRCASPCQVFVSGSSAPKARLWTVGLSGLAALPAEEEFLCRLQSVPFASTNTTVDVRYADFVHENELFRYRNGLIECPISLQFSPHRRTGRAHPLMPRGWKFGCEQYVVPSGANYVLIDEANTSRVFSRARGAQSNYFADSGVDCLLLEVKEDGYEITSPDGHRRSFSAKGLLEESVFPRGGSSVVLRLGYVLGQLRTIGVEDEGGLNSVQVASISYTSSSVSVSLLGGLSASATVSGGALTALTDVLGRQYGYSYDSGDPDYSMLSCLYQGQELRVGYDNAFGGAVGEIDLDLREGVPQDPSFCGSWRAEGRQGGAQYWWTTPTGSGRLDFRLEPDGSASLLSRPSSRFGSGRIHRFYLRDGAGRFSLESNAPGYAASLLLIVSGDGGVEYEDDFSGEAEFLLGDSLPSLAVKPVFKVSAPSRCCLYFEAMKEQPQSAPRKLYASVVATVNGQDITLACQEATFCDAYDWNPQAIPLTPPVNAYGLSNIRIEFSLQGQGSQEYSCRRIRILYQNSPIFFECSSLPSQGEALATEGAVQYKGIEGAFSATLPGFSEQVAIDYRRLAASVLFANLRGIPALFTEGGAICGEGLEVSGVDLEDVELLLLSCHCRRYADGGDIYERYDKSFLRFGGGGLSSEERVCPAGSSAYHGSTRSFDGNLSETSSAKTWPSGQNGMSGAVVRTTVYQRNVWGQAVGGWTDLRYAEGSESVRTTRRSPSVSYAQTGHSAASEAEPYGANGETISRSFGYDSLGRLATVASGGDRALYREYDGTGALKRAEFGTATDFAGYVFSYDGLHALSSVALATVPSNALLSITRLYGGGPVSSLSADGWTVGYARGSNSETVSGVNGSSYSAEYDSNGLLRWEKRDSAALVEYQYRNRFDPGWAEAGEGARLYRSVDLTDQSAILYGYDEYDGVNDVKEGSYHLTIERSFGDPSLLPDDPEQSGCPDCSIEVASLFENSSPIQKRRTLTSFLAPNFRIDQTWVGQAFSYKRARNLSSLTDAPYEQTVVLQGQQTLLSHMHTLDFFADPAGDPDPQGGGSATYSYESHLTGVLRKERLENDPVDSGKNIEITYAYDASGRIEGIAHSLAFSDSASFARDAKGRLSSETGDFAASYAYDGRGNILSITRGNTTTCFGYSGDRLSSIDSDGTLFAYNQYGYPTKWRGHSVTWTGRTLTGYGDVSFSYDGRGRRRTKVWSSGGHVRSTAYKWVGGRLVEESVSMDSSERTLRYVYAEGDFPIGFVLTSGASSSAYLYERNALGDVVAICGAQGAIVCHYSYGAYGLCRVLSGTGSSEDLAWDSPGNLNPFRYRGCRYDREMDLYQMGSRFYDPGAGRFLSPDDPSFLDGGALEGANPYCYCHNDPVTYTDATGHFAISTALFLGLVGASFAIGFTASVVSQGINYGWENINGWTFLQAGIDGLFAAGSMALAYTKICLVASMAVGGVMGFAQYSIDSAFHNDFTRSGALIATGLGVLGGAISGRGAQHYMSIGSNLDDVGRSATKALLTAFDRHGYGAAYDATINLWGSRLAASLAKSYTQTFVATFAKMAVYTPISYGLSSFGAWGVGQLGWGW